VLIHTVAPSDELAALTKPAFSLALLINRRGFKKIGFISNSGNF